MKRVQQIIIRAATASNSRILPDSLNIKSKICTEKQTESDVEYKTTDLVHFNSLQTIINQLLNQSVKPV